MSDKEKHILEYLILLFGLSVVSFFFVYFRYNRHYQLFAVFAGVLLYFIWGIIHHMLEGRLRKLIVLEYFFISLFVFLIFKISLAI